MKDVDPCRNGPLAPCVSLTQAPEDEHALKKGGRMSSLVSLFRDERGASAAEYALILALVGSSIALGSLFLGSSVAGAMNDASTCIQQHGKSCGKGKAHQSQ